MGTLTSPVLVGRADEMARLVACIESAPAVAVVEGEAGVGKSRLVAELLSGPAMAGRTLLVGHCHPMRDPFPLAPVVDALRGFGDRMGGLRLSPLAGALRPILPELADRLPPPPDPLEDPSMERHRLSRALLEVLDAAGPVVLVLEDLHWADEVTSDFLVFLLKQVPDQLGLVLTWRREDMAATSPLPALVPRLPPSTASARVSLEPLHADEVKLLVGAILDTDSVSADFADYLHERTAGLPFAVEEVLLLLQERHDLVPGEGHWQRRSLDQLEVPVAIRDSVLERLSRLAPDAARVVGAAAILQEPADDPLILSVAGLRGTRARMALNEALESALLQGTGQGRYSFRHALAADAVESAVLGPERAHLHNRAARALERRGEPLPVAQLARHCKAAGQPSRWARYSWEAALQARSLGNHAASARFLMDALSAPDLPSVTRARLAQMLSEVALDGLIQEAIPELLRAVDEGGLPAAVEGSIRVNLSGILHQSGDASAGIQHLIKALPLLEQRPVTRVVALEGLAAPWVLEGSVNDHLRWLDEAEATAAKSDDPDGSLQEAVRSARTALLLSIGAPEAWATLPEHPGTNPSASERYSWARRSTNTATILYYLGHFQQAAQWAAKAASAAEDLGTPRFSGGLRATDCLLAWSEGRWGRLRETADSIREEAHDISPVVQASVVVGLLQVAQGAGDEAEPVLAEAMELAARCGAIPTMGLAAAGIGRLRLSRGDPGAAQAVAMKALQAVAAKNIWVWAADVAPVAVEALIAGQLTAEASEWVRLLAEGLEGRDAPAADAALAQCRALLVEAGGDMNEAANQFGRAGEMWTALPHPYHAALCAERRGQCLVQQDRDTAGQVLVEALTAFRSLGATWDESRVKRTVRRHRLPLPYPWRGGPTRRSSGDELSPREREVVELVSAGLTSGDIAERLFLSSRTVEHHVERALRKLGVASRKDLLARARTAGRQP